MYCVWYSNDISAFNKFSLKHVTEHIRVPRTVRIHVYVKSVFRKFVTLVSLKFPSG